MTSGYTQVPETARTCSTLFGLQRAVAHRKIVLSAVLLDRRDYHFNRFCPHLLLHVRVLHSMDSSQHKAKGLSLVLPD